jgi:hypothetical protein
MRWPNASRTACSAALLASALAGCGGSDERLPVLTALRIARLADGVAAGQGCGAPLVKATIAAVNRGEVPGPLQERLLSDANRVAATCSRAAARTLSARLRP